MKLTQAAIDKITLPRGKGETITFDDDMPGFGLRLRTGGSRTWVVQFKIGAKHRRLTLGSVDVLRADKARAAAATALAKVRLGIDPSGEKASGRQQASETFGSTVTKFLARQAGRLRPKTYADTERYLDVYCKPLHGLPIVKVNRATIASRLATLREKHGPTTADRARAALSALFSWAMQEGLAENNPVIGTGKQADATSRDRVLSDAEIRAIWNAAPRSDYGRILRLLMLTGSRREEMAGLEWSEVDREGALITLPKERTKNKLSHEIPLPGAALAIIDTCPRRAGRELVFGEGKGGFSGWSRAKFDLDEVLGINEPWRHHDIRRTVATGLAGIGVQPHIIEAVLNHSSGHKAGVAGIYNRATYAKEKRAALEAWAAHISLITA